MAEVDKPLDFVCGKAVLGNGGAPGHKLGVAADELFRLDALVHLQQVAVAVQVVEVL